MVRTQRQIERKREKAQGQSAAGPFTIREQVFHMMVDKASEYLEHKRGVDNQINYEKAICARHAVRGMSAVFTKMYGNSYAPYYREQVIKNERLAVQLAKEMYAEEKEKEAFWYGRDLISELENIRVVYEQRY